MAKTIVKENDLNVMFHLTGVTSFRGCQCFKDCDCSQNFKPAPYDFYSVQRKNLKTTHHKTLQEAETRWDLVNTLPLTNKQKQRNTPVK